MSCNNGIVVAGSSPARGARAKEESGAAVPKLKRIRLRGQAVKTSPFHGGNTGSIPVGVIWRHSQVVRQRSATPLSPVRIWLAPFLTACGLFFCCGDEETLFLLHKMLYIRWNFNGILILFLPGY